MKIALVWYGRMWKIVEEYIKKRWHELAIIIDPQLTTKKEDLLDAEFDVIIEFSIPDIAIENLKFYAKNNYKVVMATTWWYEKIDEVKKLFEESKWALIWSSNFSLWIHIFWKIIDSATKIINKFDDYDVFWHEFHHDKKADSPSWTALTTSEIILKNIWRKTSLLTETLKERSIKWDELHFTSTRWWSIPWTHSVYFDSKFDTIEIKHQARSREWFALWSVVCAEWIKNKNWYFEIRDFMKEMI